MSATFSLWGSGAYREADNSSFQVQQGHPNVTWVPPPRLCAGHSQDSECPSCQLPRGTHRPLGYGGSAGSASSPPGWGSGWRPGGGQLTSMWSHSYQSLHCSQKFHPEQRQRRQAGVQQEQCTLSLGGPRGHREPQDICSEGWMARP